MVLRAASILIDTPITTVPTPPSSLTSATPSPISLTITTLATLTVIPPLHCSPTYHGVPIDARGGGTETGGWALVLKGSCTYGCAAVKLTEMRVLKLNGEVQWEKKLA
ncbi:hypothetical protein BC829DRAFT_402521 [Chytridium lagenaria]|nr:hypothetical protein BC829DRAFT_402521 [Chytridium lagenaria]